MNELKELLTRLIGLLQEPTELLDEIEYIAIKRIKK